MPDAISMRVEGVDQLLKKLTGLPTKIRNKHLRQSMRKGGKTVLAKAKELVPVDADKHQLPGGKHLRDTLKLRVAKKRSSSEMSFKVMTGTRAELGIPAGEKGFYPFALEYGDVLNWQPIPYMRPAYKATEAPVIRQVRADIEAAIEIELK